MKGTILILGVAVLIRMSACNNKVNSDAQTAPSPDTLKLAEKSQLADTLHYKDQVIHLEPIDRNEFYSLSPAPGIKIDSISRINTVTVELTDDTSNVIMHDTTLVLKFDNKDSIIFVSTPRIETGRIYTYVCKIKQLNSYYIKSREMVFDGSNFSVWNKAQAKETKVFGFPIESPNKKTVICYNFCFASDGASENGFQIFSLDKDYTLDLKWAVTADPSYWGPAECRWKDDQTIYIKSKHVDSKGLQTKYEKLVLPDFSK